MGLFGKKELDTGEMDFLYGKGSFSLQRNSTSDASAISNQMNNLNLYGNSGNNAFPRSKDQSDRSASPNWGSSWGQPSETSTGADLWNRSTSIGSSNKGGFPQGFGMSSNASLSTGLSSMTSRPSVNTNNTLLQFSRSMSSPSFPNTSGSPSQASDFPPNYRLLSGQSSPRGQSGLLSLSQQQMQNSLQHHRGVIGQLPSLSMQGHSPSGSPGLNISNKLITPPQSQQQQQLPKSSASPFSSSSIFPNTSASLSSSLTGQGLSAPGQFPRSLSTNSISQQSLLNSMLPPSLSSAFDGTTNNVFTSPASATPIGTAFDADFPALANKVGSSQSSRLGQNSFSFVMSGGSKTLDASQEFQIQNEDFPALPGAPTLLHEGGVNTQGLGGLMPHSQHHQPQLTQDSSKDSLLDGYSIGSYEQILKDGRLHSDGKLKSPVSGIQTNSSGVLTNIPSGMVTDQFGMIGLLTFIRAAETEPNLVTLALGSDLTTLGLNLNSTESLYHTFGSPFSDSTCKPHEIDFYAPQEYLISSYIRDKLAPIKLGRYGEDLLFYLYYTNCGDILQLAAAAELYARDWRYHKDERVWITRFPGMEPQVKTNTYERGTYYYFDPQSWRKVAKEFHVEYDRLEEKPTAQAIQQQQAQLLAQQQSQVTPPQLQPQQVV